MTLKYKILLKVKILSIFFSLSILFIFLSAAGVPSLGLKINEYELIKPIFFIRLIVSS